MTYQILAVIMNSNDYTQCRIKYERWSVKFLCKQSLSFSCQIFYLVKLVGFENLITTWYERISMWRTAMYTWFWYIDLNWPRKNEMGDTKVACSSFNLKINKIEAFFFPSKRAASKGNRNCEIIIEAQSWSESNRFRSHTHVRCIW